MKDLPRVTRGKILKLLREFDQERQKHPNTNIVLETKVLMWGGTEEEPREFEETVNLSFEYINYEYLIRAIYGGPTIRQGNLEFNVPIGIVRDEIQRMVNDGLVTLEEQWINFRLVKENGEEDSINPDGMFPEDDIEYYKTKIVLTTKGKSTSEFLFSQFPENATAWFALLVSAVALLVSIFK